MKAQAVKLNDRVYWVGAIDWGMKEFHGYETQGSTYNAYLIIADKITLIDTVRADFADEMLARIASVVDPSKIDYIISNHTEMDHSSALPKVLEIIKPEKLFASKEGVKALNEHFKLPIEVTPVGDSKLDLGGAHLSFIETRMIHWPESMFTYFEEDGILFSQDGFGMHLASSERFDDEIDFGRLKYEAAKYYANILNPFSNLVAKLLEKLGKLNLDIKMIAPDHGPVWRSHISDTLSWYGAWSDPKRTAKALIVYDTMWHSTEKLAVAISEGMLAGGAKPRIMPLTAFHASDIVTELLDSGALVVGCPTFNGGVLPSVAAFMQYIKGLKFRHMLGAAFGSYGWSPAVVKQLNEQFEAMRIELAGEGVQAKFVPDDAALEQAYNLGFSIAGKLKNNS